VAAGRFIAVMTNSDRMASLLHSFRIVALALFVIGAAAPAWGQGSRPPVLVDRIVALVGKQVITRFELNERIERTVQELRARKIALPAPDELQKQVLERLIVERVQLKHAEETGLRVDDQTVDAALLRVAENNNLTLTQFRQALEKDGITLKKFREDLRTEILVSRLRDRDVEGRITVAESEIDLFMADQENTKDQDSSAEYEISHILVRVPEQASPEQISERRSRVEEALKRVRAGSEFAQVAAAFSDAPEALAGGGLGWRVRDRLPDLFVDALVKMKPGDVSEILRSPAGFHVLKLTNQRGAGAPFLIEQNLARHILVRVNEIVSESEAQRKLVNLRERIINGVDFGELAKLNSDDGSAARGGDLGWLYPGDTVPEFERAMRELKVGEVSQPVKSPFGWHLIQVSERRMADMAADRKRLEARRFLRDKKSDEAYQEWVRQLRDRTYVEYRLDER